MRLDKIFASTLVAFVALLGILFGWNRLTYNWEFDALRRTLEENRYEIIGQTRHEDLTLEDFSFTARTSKGEFRINILDGSEVRTPDDKIEGISIRYPNERALRSVRFDTSYWRTFNIPEINTLADLMKHMPPILEALRASPPPQNYPDDTGTAASHALAIHKTDAALLIPQPPADVLPAH